IESLSGDQRKDSQLIGQFGVGFYSSFIVADKVTVLTKRADADEAVRWESDGQGEFVVEPSFKQDRGTEVILHLREDDKEFLEPFRLKSIVRKYSDHIGLPIRMRND
ncbi:UNVERIFIED_CONTAM: molecular chaperone HtpG, partial [Salmonella enterica subsp. enterica serovar Weltevreden]